MAISFGKYQLLRKLAAGGMGQLFLALERGASFERLVVLKLLLPHLAEDEEFLAMFLEEARLVARLSHPHIIRILDVAEVDGRQCLALEYVQGDDLRRLDRQARRKGRPLPVGLILRIIADVAAGLDYAHQARDAQGLPLRLVHRDVSPQNILVGYDGGVKVIDFGLAKAAGSAQITISGVLKGKYPYMSPEQAAGQSVDARSDQFSLGVVLWELLTGRRLFKGDTDMMTLQLVRDCQVPPPSQLVSGLPPGLDTLVLRVLAPTPQARFRDCGDLRLALEEILLKNRLPASNAHLTNFLQELYADRVAREAELLRPDPAAEETIRRALMPIANPRPELSATLPAQPSPRRDSAQATARPMPRTPAPTLPPPPPPESLVESTASQASRWTKVPEPRTTDVSLLRASRSLLLAAVLGLLVAGAVVLLMRGLASVEPPALAPQPAPLESRAPPPPAPEPPAHVSLELRSEPPGASVKLDGELQGQAPVRLQLAPLAPPVTVRLELEGHEPLTRSVSAVDAPVLSLRLVPRRSQRATSPRPPLGIKTDR